MRYKRWYQDEPRVYTREHRVIVTDWYPLALAALMVWLGTLTVVVALALR